MAQVVTWQDHTETATSIATALDAAPEAAAFFDSLAQFYRTAWLRWIDSTKRRPDQRSMRIAEMVSLLHQGHNERPDGALQGRDDREFQARTDDARNRADFDSRPCPSEGPPPGRTRR